MNSTKATHTSARNVLACVYDAALKVDIVLLVAIVYEDIEITDRS